MSKNLGTPLDGLDMGPHASRQGRCPMTRYEQLTSQIEANFEKLATMPQNSPQARELRHEQSNLLTARLNLTIGQEVGA